MDSSDVFFEYVLPEGRIAQRPVASGANRADAKMLVASYSNATFPTGELRIVDETFSRLPEILRPGDLLIFNNSLVLPVRLFATLNRSSRTIEVLLVRPIDDNASEGIEHQSGQESWLALVRPMKKLRFGDELDVAGKLRIVSGLRSPEAEGRLIELRLSSNSDQSVRELILELGTMPIPPYIRQGNSDDLDRVDYQTVFAQIPGSIAAPTAGLHFTNRLLEELKAGGVECCYVTLHVGAGSFFPIEADDISKHRMIGEYYAVDQDVWTRIVQAKERKGRVIAVGTTVTRTLETVALRLSESGPEKSGPEKSGFENALTGTSELFITPGFKFQVVDGLITNFHQPRTTHLLLVSAFMGGRSMRSIYEHALKNEFQLLSYGDGMLLFPEVGRICGK